MPSACALNAEAKSPCTIEQNEVVIPQVGQSLPDKLKNGHGASPN